MLSFDDALTLVVSAGSPIGSEKVALADAGGRILAGELRARVNAPPVDVAAMDGYAIVEGGGDKSYHVIGESLPGRPASGHDLGTREAVRIFTGAAMPSGADRVVIQENATRQGDSVTFTTEATGSRHIRRIGTDFSVDDILLPAGRFLDSRAMLIAAAADHSHLQVSKRPRLSLLATGDEIRPPGMSGASMIAVPDSVSSAVAALAATWGAHVANFVRAPDDMATIEQEAGHLVGQSNILIITGGASMGDRDFSKSALNSLGLELLFSKVAMKPGKPIWMGRIEDTYVIGLPGNPTAALVTARLFLAPLLCLLAGRPVSDALACVRRPRTAHSPQSKAARRSCVVIGMDARRGISVRRHPARQNSPKPIFLFAATRTLPPYPPASP